MGPIVSRKADKHKLTLYATNVSVKAGMRPQRCLLSQSSLGYWNTKPALDEHENVQQGTCILYSIIVLSVQ